MSGALQIIKKTSAPDKQIILEIVQDQLCKKIIEEVSKMVGLLEKYYYEHIFNSVFSILI